MVNVMRIIIVLICILCETGHLKCSSFLHRPGGRTLIPTRDRILTPKISVGVQASLSNLDDLSNDYLLPAITALPYSYGVQMGFGFGVGCTGMGIKKSEIRDLGIILDISNFDNTFYTNKGLNKFTNDTTNTFYELNRGILHKSTFVALRPQISFSLSFLPRNLLLVSEFCIGYKVRELYEDVLQTNDVDILRFIPRDLESQAVEGSSNQFLIKKSTTANTNSLIGFGFGISYQFTPYSRERYNEEKDIVFYIEPTYFDLWIGFNYLKGNVTGYSIGSNIFYGINLKSNFFLL